VGEDAVIADQAHVRERSAIGAESVVGRAVGVENDVVVGARVRVQAGAYLTAHCTVEDDVFVAPNVTTTNDQTIGRRPPGTSLRGAVIRRAARIGAGSLLLPGIEIGEEAVVGAGAVVTRDVAPSTLVMGVPARPVRETRDDERLPTGRT
jgi:acetyltransferase-like isoleucine patch superfamily enzyme